MHGASGSGKTTLAVALGERLGLPHTELDGLYHQPHWTELDTGAFRDQVGRVVAGDRWVVDGNYRQVRDLVWERAEMIVILDLPRSMVMRQLIWRSVTRAAVGRELWNGNRESFSNLLSANADRNVVLWSWRTHHRYRQEVPDEVRSRAAHARRVVLHSHRTISAFVDGLVPAP